MNTEQAMGMSVIELKKSPDKALYALGERMEETFLSVVWEKRDQGVFETMKVSLAGGGDSCGDENCDKPFCWHDKPMKWVGRVGEEGMVFEREGQAWWVRPCKNRPGSFHQIGIWNEIPIGSLVAILAQSAMTQVDITRLITPSRRKSGTLPTGKPRARIAGSKKSPASASVVVESEVVTTKER